MPLILLSADKVGISNIVLDTSFRYGTFLIEIRHNGVVKRTQTKKANGGRPLFWSDPLSFDVTNAILDILEFRVIEMKMGFVRMTVGSRKKQVIDLRRLKKSPVSYTLDFTNGFHLILTIEWLGKIKLPYETRNISLKQSKYAEPADVFLYNTLRNQGNEEAWLSLLPCFGTSRSLAEDFPEDIAAQSKYSNTIDGLSQHLQEVYECMIGANEVTQHQRQALLVLIEQTIECAYSVLELGRIKTVSTVWRGVDIAEKAKDLHEKLNHITRQTQVCLSHPDENRPGPASIGEIRFF